FGLWARGRLRTTAPPVETPPLIESVRASLAHRSFLALAGSFMLFNLGYQMLVAFLPYYLVVTLGRSENDVTYFTGGVISAALLALPFLTFAARRVTKRALYAGSMAALGAYLLFLTVGAFRPLIPGIDLFSQSVALISLSGLGFAALFVFPGAMVADVIDDDSRRTGQGRAAIFYGMFKTLEKIAQAGAIVLLGLLFALFGNTSEQPLGIQLAMPVGGACVLAGFAAVFLFYHLRESPRDAAEAVAPAPAEAPTG
ncbi:MAG: MFS transporter, partial [Actinomycetota bacterium]|nr:MFS transporter [Actinomycetota bacterium]